MIESAQDRSDPRTRLRRRLAGEGKCYVCGEPQHGNAHLGCTSRYELNQDVQALLAFLPVQADAAKLQVAEERAVDLKASADGLKRKLDAAESELAALRAKLEAAEREKAEMGFLVNAVDDALNGYPSDFQLSFGIVRRVDNAVQELKQLRAALSSSPASPQQEGSDGL